MRDTKAIESFLKKNLKEIKELSLFRYLKKASKLHAGQAKVLKKIIKKK